MATEHSTGDGPAKFFIVYTLVIFPLVCAILWAIVQYGDSQVVRR